MTQTGYDVLVVDDDSAAGQDYARLIAQGTGLLATYTADHEEAREIVRTNRLSVVVLDQRMPQASGTELFGQLRRIDPRLCAILLTGEADLDDVGNALNLGFNQYLHKNKVRLLPAAVLHEYIDHQGELVSADIALVQPVLLKRKSRLFSRSSISYRLMGIEILADVHVFPEQWTELMIIQAGQTERREVTANIERSVVLETESTQKMSAALGLSVKQVATLNSQLQAELTARLKSSDSYRVAGQSTAERTFQLPAEPEDVNKIHVRARRIQQAPVFNYIRADVLAECNFCSRPNLVSLRAYVATGGIALKHEDHFSDGTVRTVFLGATPYAPGSGSNSD